MARPLWSLALSSILPDLAEQDLDSFCQSVLLDRRIRDRLRTELLVSPTHHPSELANTDLVELFHIENEMSDLSACVHNTDFSTKLVHLGALPFRIRASICQLFREKDSGRYRNEHCSTSPDGRFQLVVQVNQDTDLSDAFDHLEDAYMRVLEELKIEHCIPFPDEWEEVDVSDVYGVQPDSALYDAFNVRLNDQETQVRESITEDFIAFFAESPFQLAGTVEEKHVSIRRSWTRKPRVRIVLVGE